LAGNSTLVQSLEVAEHLDAQAADEFVDNLVRHGRLILFSAALPGQGGERHINEQPLDDWRSRFLARGYEALPRPVADEVARLRYRLLASNIKAWQPFSALIRRDTVMLERLRQPDWETSTYLFLAVANLMIGCFLIYTWPNKIINADAEQYYEISKALVGKGGELSYARSSWGYPIFLILTGVPWTRWPVIAQVIQVCMTSAIPYFVGSTLRRVGVGAGISISGRHCFVFDSANGVCH
jgi:hypothetical protein